MGRSKQRLAWFSSEQIAFGHAHSPVEAADHNLALAVDNENCRDAHGSEVSLAPLPAVFLAAGAASLAQGVTAMYRRVPTRRDGSFVPPANSILFMGTTARMASDGLLRHDR